MFTARFAVASVLLLSAGAHAQDVINPALCNAVLDQGIADNYQFLSDTEQQSAYRSRLCEANFSSYSQMRGSAGALGLDIPLAEAFIGLDGSFDQKSQAFSQSYSQMCSALDLSDASRQRISQYSSRISAALTRSWNQCHANYLQAYTQQRQIGTFISVTPQDGLGEFSVVLQIRTVGPGPHRVEHISPSSSDLQCRRGGAAIVPGETSFNSNLLQFDCTKDPDKTVRFAIESTAGPSNVVTVPARPRELDAIRRQLAALERQVAATTAELQLLSGRQANQATSIEALRSWGAETGRPAATWGGRAGESEVVSCPAGSYVAGVSVIDQDNGGSCVSCINGVRIVCRPLGDDR